MENNSQAIEIKGVVRNQTKIGVQDGQCDDIVNLRFKDGSWRVADDGKMIVNSAGTPFSVYPYTQLYVHTNVYHHLLGVFNGKLWWFANIDADNETFSYVTNNEGDPDAIEICDVQGDVTIVQNGHLLTIVNKGGIMYYSIFRTDKNEYVRINIDANGKQTDRGLFPFGRVCFNLNCEYNAKRDYVVYDENGGKLKIYNSSGEINFEESGPLCSDKTLWHNAMLKSFSKCLGDNNFANPFLAIAALKMYDGSYVYASAPVLLSPRERFSSYKYLTPDSSINDLEKVDDITFFRNACYYDDDNKETILFGEIALGKGKNYTVLSFRTGYVPCYLSGAHTSWGYTNTDNNQASSSLSTTVLGASLVITLDDVLVNIVKRNHSIFTGLSIFITKESPLYYMSSDDYKKGEIYTHNFNSDVTPHVYVSGANICYKPGVRPDKEVIYDLMNSPFYLLRTFSLNELEKMSNTSTEVDLSGPEYKGLLEKLTSQPTLTLESTDRKNFFPRAAYQYNTKLHIANYDTEQFHGYPIDYFQLNNHCIKVEKGSYAIGGTLPDTIEIEDLQYPRTKRYFAEGNASHMGEKEIDQYIINARKYGTCFAYISVKLLTQSGEQRVTRYIAPYNSNSVNAQGSLLDEACFNYGDPANFVEDLGPLLTFPDNRAAEMEIKFIGLYEGDAYIRSGTFELTPHPYLNMAYYINPELMPIKLEDQEVIEDINDVWGDEDKITKLTPPKELNNIESYVSGLKVSEANNPMIFPVENTYQVGSSGIVALMSNAVAIGTGQTGAAPLYVFCKDGIYALMVDNSGEMTYTNARIIARDVCNNAKSVTPIDSGVVFTTDRGLMTIAGSEVVEIGSAAEGDVFDITDTSDNAKKIMFNAFTMQQLAEFPQSLVDNTDFLTYLKGAIVNYNHNERELMVSNPDKDYTYVMDRNGNWSRRAFTAQEYVNNYPTSYRIDKDDNLFKVDADDNNTNKVYLLSNVIKLGTIAFKQAYRLVVRGYFDTESYIHVIDKGYEYSIPFSALNNGTYEVRLGKTMQLAEGNYQVDIKGLLANEYKSNGVPEEAPRQIIVRDVQTKEDIAISNSNKLSKVSLPFVLTKETEIEVICKGYFYNARQEDMPAAVLGCENVSIKVSPHLGCYVFGSYDGRQWSLLGGNEKQGKFTDIGCKISHTDIRFLRVCLAGKLSKNTRIDYIEVSAEGSALNGKLR